MGVQPAGPSLDLGGSIHEITTARLDLVRVWWWRMTPAWSMPRRVMGNGLLYAPIDQEVVVEIGDEVFTVEPGSVAVLPEGIPHAARYRHRPRGTFDLACFHLRLTDRNGCDVLRRYPRRALPLPDQGSVAMLRRLAERWYGGGDDGLAAAAAGARSLLVELAIAANGFPPAPAIDPRVEQCLQAMAADPAGRVAIETIAQQAHVSTRRLRDLFRYATGTTPKGYQIRLRISEAMHLLADPRLRIKDVAAKLGFSSDHEFHAAFRRHHGSTPTAWRQRLAAEAP